MNFEIAPSEAWQPETTEAAQAPAFTAFGCSGAMSVRVVLRDPLLIASLGSETLATEPADPAVQAVRQMLREKKAR